MKKVVVLVVVLLAMVPLLPSILPKPLSVEKRRSSREDGGPL